MAIFPKQVSDSNKDLATQEDEKVAAVVTITHLERR